MPLYAEQLSLGAPAAERDINEGLADYFVESDAYRRVSEGSKRIIIGNRGAGKSAIFKVLARRERERGTIVIELAPEDYSYEMLSSIMLQERHGSWAKLGAYAVAWKYLLYLLVMKALDRTGGWMRRGAAGQIHGYLRDKHRGAQDNPISALISYLKRLESVKIGKLEANVRTRELERLYKLEEIQHLLPALRDVCDRKRVIVLVDELDRGWDASEDAKAFVAGLFQASAGVNALSENLRVYLSLRQELYDTIPALYEDAQKYRDIAEELSWDESSLLNLVANRIRYSIPKLKHITDEACWGSVFTRHVVPQYSGSFDYMLDRTLYRPREIITFCAQALDTSRHRRASLPVSYDILNEAEFTYSEERVKDIVAEYRFQYPQLLGVFEVFRGKSRTLKRDELEYLCLGIATGEFFRGAPSSWMHDQDPERLIDVLWRIGFLRARSPGGRSVRQRSGHQYLGHHQTPNLNLQLVNRFQIHPMFWAYLGVG